MTKREENETLKSKRAKSLSIDKAQSEEVLRYNYMMTKSIRRAFNARTHNS